MMSLDEKAIIDRIEHMARKVYRNNKNAVYMLINDLEEFFEIENCNKDIEKMTSEEFNKYINQIND